MSVLSAEFPAEVKIRIDDNWLDNYGDTQAYVDCRDLDSTNTRRRMRPRGILIGRNATDTNAIYATVKGVLWGENHNQADTYTLSIGQVHPISFKLIYANGTTGRWIKVFG